MADSPVIKMVVIGVFLMILMALASAGLNLFRRGGKKDDHAGTVKALTVRVALSFALVIFIGVLYALGIIQPNH